MELNALQACSFFIYKALKSKSTLQKYIYNSNLFTEIMFFNRTTQSNLFNVALFKS